MEIRLIKILKKKNKSIYGLAKYSGIAYSTAHALVHGKTGSVRLDVLKKVCDFLEEPVENIITIVS